MAVGLTGRPDAPALSSLRRRHQHPFAVLDLPQRLRAAVGAVVVALAQAEHALGADHVLRLLQRVTQTGAELRRAGLAR